MHVVCSILSRSLTPTRREKPSPLLLQADAVLCPICKRDYLVQAGHPSASIVCACGFRLDTAGDRLGLEHLRQQLAETYSQHR